MERVFLYSDYREFLQHWVREHDSWGLITEMAEAAGCQRSHLSRVLNSNVHLTTDQAFGLAEFMKLGELETEYFLTLVDLARAATLKNRQRLERKLAQLKRQDELSVKRLRKETHEWQGHEMLYYSAWYWSAIHLIVSIPDFQTVDAISQRLSLSPATVSACLEGLAKMSLVKQEKGRWSVINSVHIPRESPLISLHHNNWRQRAIGLSQQPDEDGLHYTVVQTLSRADFEKLKQMILSWIDQYASVANPSKEEDLICFTCDFFRVS